MKTIKEEKIYLQRGGSVLVLVLLAIVILLVTGTGLLALSEHGQIQAIRTGAEIAARSAADAGLTMAVFEMNEQLEVEPWDDGILPEATDEALPNCDAVFSCTVTGDVGGGYTIVSTGNCGRAEKTVSCILPLKGPFESAIFGRQGISLNSGTVVDWYNYDADDEDFQIGTNSIISDSIDLKNGVTVNGDVVVGLSGDPAVVIKDGGATIRGEIYAASETYELPAIMVPGWLGPLPSGGTIEDDTTISSSGKFDEINLETGKTIIIDGDVTLYVIGDITLKNSAELQIADNGSASLILYLGGDFEGKNGSNVNNLTEDPQKIKIYGLGSCQSIVLKNSSDFYGAIYTPNADVVMHNSVDVFGSVVADSYEQKAASVFQYDASLRDVSVNDEAVRFVVKNWSDE